MNEWVLENGYKIRQITDQEFDSLYRKHQRNHFDEQNQIFRLTEAFSKEELERFEKLKKQMGESIYKLHLLAESPEGKFAGYTFGFQESGITFYMCSSLVAVEHRRKGLYTSLLEKVMELTVAEGFQTLYSRHYLSNNSVIIPKLKKGFHVSGIETSDLFGTTLILTYYSNATRNEVFSYRTGETKPSEKVSELLRIQ